MAKYQTYIVATASGDRYASTWQSALKEYGLHSTAIIFGVIENTYKVIKYKADKYLL